MTTAVLQALSGSKLSAAFARLLVEVEAFFEEAGVAVARANAEQPYGL